LRRAADPLWRDTNIPYLKASDGSQIKVKKGVGRRRPVANRESISARLLRLTERGSLLLPTNSNRQPLPSLGAPASQHQPSALGGHSGPEPVIVELLAIRWLKRSFHSSLLISKLALEYSNCPGGVKALMTGLTLGFLPSIHRQLASKNLLDKFIHYYQIK